MTDDRTKQRRFDLIWDSFESLCGLGLAAGFVMFLAVLFWGCGTAQSVTSAAACNTLIVAIGEARQLAPERAVADIRTVSAVCRRLQDAPDAGTDGSTP